MAAVVFCGNQHSKFAELVGLSRMNRYANGTLIKFNNSKEAVVISHYYMLVSQG